jgi:hypothetical protein
MVSTGRPQRQKKIHNWERIVLLLQKSWIEWIIASIGNGTKGQHTSSSAGLPNFRAGLEMASRCMVYVQGKLPRYQGHQPEPKDKIKTEQVKKKLWKVRSRNYIEKGPVLSLTGYFDVPKTIFDIRMVYDASKCRLNKVVWAPNSLHVVSQFFIQLLRKRYLGGRHWFTRVPPELPVRFVYLSLCWSWSYSIFW